MREGRTAVMTDEGIVIPRHMETSGTAAPVKEECRLVSEWGNFLNRFRVSQHSLWIL